MTSLRVELEPPAELLSFAERQARNSQRQINVDRRSDVEVWSRPHLFLLALAFLGAEWILRRRRGFL